METQEIETEVSSLTVQAKNFLIQNHEQYTSASDLWNLAKDLRAKISETFDPIISKAHAAHKEAVGQKKKHDEPLEMAQRTIKGKMIAWDQEQARIARLEQARLEAEAKKKADEEALELATLLEEAGQHEAAAEAIEKPEVAPVVVEKSTPKVSGFSYRTNFRIEVTNLAALVKAVADGKVNIAALEANTTYLRQQATALKKEAFEKTHPGVIAHEDKV